MSLNESSLMIKGPAGDLETIIQSVTSDNEAAVGIICHPHPLHGGTMNNKVVTTLARTFRDLGMINIRFNYRGVGKSDGSYGDGIGETEDTLAIIHYAENHWPKAKIWLAGFSFGAYVSLQAATIHKNIRQLISIAPAVNHANFENLHPHCPWLVIIAEKDDIVPANKIKTWAKQLSPPPDILEFPDTTHFFDGKLVELREQLLIKLRHAHPF